MSEQRSLVKKLVEVMKEVKYIQKRGFNKFHKYNYATEADVNEKVREELSKVNVIMIPNMVSHDTREHTNRNGNVEYIVTVNMEFKFIDGESSEEITFNMSGSGQDAGDKGIFKAIAGAQKYALMKAFMIPTGDDPEADSGVDERNDNNKSAQNSKKSMLLVKWKTLEYPEEKFEEWYEGQQEKGYNETQMERYLTTKLVEKNKQGA
jgi:ACT domain-containing protein